MTKITIENTNDLGITTLITKDYGDYSTWRIRLEEYITILKGEAYTIGIEHLERWIKELREDSERIEQLGLDIE